MSVRADMVSVSDDVAVVRTRRAFTLIEAAIVIVTISIAVPPSLVMINEVVGQRADSVNTTRATTLAGAVMEQILADMGSDAPGLGFSALDNPTVYVETSTTGLRDRVSWITDAYTASGVTFGVVVGGLVSSSGLETGDTTQDVFRMVTVTASLPMVQGSTSFSVQALVTGT